MSQVSARYHKHSRRQVHEKCNGCGTDKLFFGHEIVDMEDFSQGICQSCSRDGQKIPNAPLVFLDMSTLKPHACVPVTGADGKPSSGGASPQEIAEAVEPLEDPQPQDPWNDTEKPGEMEQWEAELLGSVPIDQQLADISAQVLGDVEQAQEEADAISSPTLSMEIEAPSEPPFPEDDEYVTHAELNEFDPLSREDAKKSFDNVRNGMVQIASLEVRNNKRVSDLVAAMVDLEKRTRITIDLTRPDGTTTVIEGLHHYQLPDVIRMLSVEHVLMVGGAGAGKGEIARQAADALGLRFLALPGSLSPQTQVSAIMGYRNSAGEYINTLFREAFENGGLIFLDELDNAHPACIAAVNDALAIRAGQEVAFPDGMVKRHADFRVLAAANTFGRGPDRTYAARQRGDAATWDRFAILGLKYDEGLEDVLCRQTGLEEEKVVRVVQYIRELRRNVDKHQGTIPVVIGMRASVGICRLLSAGITADAAVEMRARRGMSDQDWEKITSNVPVLTGRLRSIGQEWAKPKPDLASVGESAKPALSSLITSGDLGITASEAVNNTFVSSNGNTYIHSDDRKKLFIEHNNHLLEISNEVLMNLQKGNSISAIKRFRLDNPTNEQGQYTPSYVGLKEAKDIIEMLKKDFDNLNILGVDMSKPPGKPTLVNPNENPPIPGGGWLNLPGT